MIVCFAGIDGSGKSFQARRLVQRLNDAGRPAVYVWGGGWSTLTGPLTRAAQRLLGAPRGGATASVSSPESTKCTKGTKLEVSDKKALFVSFVDQKRRKGDRFSGQPEDDPPAAGEQYRAYLSSTQRLFRRPLVRGAWLHVSLAEHACELWALLLPHLLRGRVVVCDRYIYDSVISLAVLAGADAAHMPGLLRAPEVGRVPRPSRAFFLDVPSATAFARKDDIPDLLFLERREPLYRAAAAALGMQPIDGTASPDAIAELIWRGVQPLAAPAAGAALPDEGGS